MNPLVLLILDGWGIAPPNPGNAIELAYKPNFDFFWNKYPHTQLQAHGRYVGLPDGEVGNSEAGHINIGAGRVIKDDAIIINEDIENGKFGKNLAINEAIDFVKKNNSTLHLMGLITDICSPHSCPGHLVALVDLAYKQGLRNIYLHLFTDGRDSSQFSALKIIDELLKNIYGKAVIASIIGRFYAMDRGKNWSRTKKAYDCLVGFDGLRFVDYRDAIVHAYNQGQTDEYIEPSIVCKSAKQIADSRIKENDGAIFFNLRSDRARQLTKCFVQDKFNQENPGAFRRTKVIKNLKFCTLTDFGPDLDSILTAYPSADIQYSLPAVLKGKKQLYIAETEKYAHMTYFINGGHANPVNGEERIRIPSAKIKSYALRPEMSVYEITKKIKQSLNSGKYDFIAANFANPDMVGHTGDFKATIKAVEHVDKCLGQVANLIIKQKGAIIVTADHGNAEKEYDFEKNEIWTSHTTNPVPFILIDNELKGVKLRAGLLGDIAPTIYDWFNLKNLPKKINKSLIKK